MQQLVRLNPGKLLYRAVWPLYPDLLHPLVLSQAKMQSTVILAAVMDAAILYSHLGYPACRNINAGTDPIMIRSRTLEVDLQPMVAVSHVAVELRTTVVRWESEAPTHTATRSPFSSSR